MRRASRKRPASRHATPTSPLHLGDVSTATLASAATEVFVSPADPFNGSGASVPQARGERRQRLPSMIHQRIESRLSGRVRNLKVRLLENTVLLEGQCATYYTKQLAQHAALGVLEDEHLENAIVVRVPR